MNSQTVYRAMVEAQSLIRNEGRGTEDPRGMNRRFRQAHTFEKEVLFRLSQRDSLAAEFRKAMLDFLTARSKNW